MSVINMVVGAATPSGATFVTKVNGGGPVRIKVANNSSMTGATFFGSVSVNAQGVAKVNATGLTANTRYWWQVEDNGMLDTSSTGQFRTFPTLGSPASYRFGAASCAGARTFHPIVGPTLRPKLSNHPVFDIIRQKALAENWLFFAHLGDLHYYDLGEAGDPAPNLTNYRRSYDDVLLQNRQHDLYSQVNWVYTWDNHDFYDNTAGSASTGKEAARQAYRERVPHYPLAAGSGNNPIYHSFEVGRHLFIVADVYSERVQFTTILGSAQKAWMDNLLATTNAEFVVWLMGGQFIHPQNSSITWGAYPAERAEMIEMFGDRGFLDRMAIVSGDRHSIGIDSGNPASSVLNPNGFPVFHCASLDSGGGGGTNDVGYDIAESPGRQRYGSFFVYDDGTHIAINGTVWARDRALGWLSHGV